MTGIRYLAFVLATASALHAQQAERAVPTIEPRYTRIFSSDTMGLWGPDISPDGRWVVASGPGDGDNTANLWIAPAAGGTAERLTSGRFYDYWARWFPSSDRIAFLSNRPSHLEDGASEFFLMTIPIDRQTGRPTGPPRQVTLEQAGGLVAISPDGGWIAYRSRSWPREGMSRIMAVPASGGTAREIAAHPSQQLGTGWPFLQWSADGRSIHYSLLKAGTAVQALMRVPASGGRPQELGTMPPRVLDVDGQGRYLLRLIDQPERMFSGVTPSPAIEIATVGGRPVARFVRRRGMWVWRFTADGRGAIAQHANVVAPIRVVPVAGGAVRQVSDERLYYWPLGWSADGSRVFAETDANGHRVILESPLDGSAAREWPIPAGARNIELSRDGRYLWFTSATSDPEVDQLFVQRLDGSEQRRVAPDYFNARTGVVGPGGSQASDELFFFKRRQGRLELWSARADGTSRLVHAFPLNLADRTRFAVHGARVAYVERRGDSTALLVVEGQNGRPSQLAIAAGTLQEPAWSNDGHGIAVQYYAAGDSARHAIAFVSVGSNGMAASPLRFVRTGRDYGYQVQWLPDDQAVTVFCGLGGAGTGVWLVSPRDGERPTELTRDEAAEFWSYRVSPDGRYVAYAAEIGRGSSIWRLDFGDVLARAAKD